MPDLSSEVLGVVAVVALLLVFSLLMVAIDPKARARRHRNRIQRHAVNGCGVCRLELIALTRPNRPAGGKQARR